ncbi:MAG: hypothetical protein QF893_04395 [Alphaproteobacteria bacterium]|nr:hypothetical protein [Alphaproteobacteria bacterium]
MDQDDLRHIVAAMLANASVQADNLKTPKAVVRRFVEIYGVLADDDTMDDLVGATMVGKGRHKLGSGRS